MVLIANNNQLKDQIQDRGNAAAVSKQIVQMEVREQRRIQIDEFEAIKQKKKQSEELMNELRSKRPF